MAEIKLGKGVMKTLAQGANKKGEPMAQTYYWDNHTIGFGVVVGAGTKTFVARAWVGGKRRRVTIGTWPAMEVEAARAEANLLLGQMGKGTDPNAEKKKARTGGPTLREALDYHLGKMERGERRKGTPCSPRSIATTRGFMLLHFDDFLERPLTALTADVLEEMMRRMERETPRRGGSNPVNTPGRANANRVVQMVSKIWRSWLKRHPTDLTIANPATQLTQTKSAERTTRVNDADLPAWYAKLHAKREDGTPVMSPIRRDLYLLSMFTSVRADGVRNLCWDDVDFDEDLIHIAHAKGNKPYTLPMVKTVRDILENRRAENLSSGFFQPYGGDHGFCFPTMSRDGKRVIATRETKERVYKRDAKGERVRDEDGNFIRENYVEGTHTNRRTWNNIAKDIGIPLEQRETLMNHEGRGVNVKHYGSTPQNWDYVRGCAEQVEAAIWSRIRGEVTRKPRAKLRSVP